MKEVVCRGYFRAKRENNPYIYYPQRQFPMSHVLIYFSDGQRIGGGGEHKFQGYVPVAFFKVHITSDSKSVFVDPGARILAVLGLHRDGGK